MATLYGTRDDGARDIILSFDDGPKHDTTGPLLDILGSYDIRAMFFVVGQLMEDPRGREIVQRAHADGHTIGNHTYTHPNLCQLPIEKIRTELARTHEMIVRCTGSCEFFRPPYGASSKNVDTVAAELGYTSVSWTVDPRDWDSSQQTDGAWVDYAIMQIEPREDSHVLLHDIYPSTVDKIEQFIERVHGIPGCRFAAY